MVEQPKTNKNKRYYSPETKKRLYMFNGPSCCNPQCRKSFENFNNSKLVNQIAHIQGFSKNGPRFNSLLSDKELDAYENLLLLCYSCHQTVDAKVNELIYPVELLKEWKKTREEEITSRITSKGSLLTTVILAIADTELLNETDKAKTNILAFKIPDKIAYNNLNEFSLIIDKYIEYNQQIEELYSELSTQKSLKLEILLSKINDVYLRIAGKYIIAGHERIHCIANNADTIFLEIHQELCKIVKKETNLNDEEIEASVYLIMTDAFMRCRILEPLPEKT